MNAPRRLVQCSNRRDIPLNDVPTGECSRRNGMFCSPSARAQHAQQKGKGSINPPTKKTRRKATSQSKSRRARREHKQNRRAHPPTTHAPALRNAQAGGEQCRGGRSCWSGPPEASVSPAPGSRPCVLEAFSASKPQQGGGHGTREARDERKSGKRVQRPKDKGQKTKIGDQLRGALTQTSQRLQGSRRCAFRVPKYLRKD